MHQLDDVREHIRSHVSMREVLELCGIDPPQRDGKIKSIYVPKEKTPSMHIYQDHYFCYATGKGGDQIQFVQDYQQISFKAAVERLNRGGDPLARRIEIETPAELPNLGQDFFGAPEPTKPGILAAFDTLVSKKWPTLTAHQIMEYGSRLTDSHLWTPHWEQVGSDWIIRGIKTRQVYTGVKRAFPGSSFRQGLYYCTPRHMGNAAVIVEGESDTWVLSKAAPWVDVYGLPSGAGLWRDVWRTGFKVYHTEVLIALDGDKAGTEATERIAGSLKSANIKHRIVNVPGGRVAEAVAEGWNLDE